MNTVFTGSLTKQCPIREDHAACSPCKVGHVMRRTFTTILVAFCAATISAGPALACSCAPNPTAKRILDQSAAVFTGVAQENLRVPPDRSITTFRIVEPFKGTSAGDVVRVLHRSGSSASCGVKFTPGASYTLAAYRTETSPGLSTSLCSTWMFKPIVGLSRPLIEQMRALRKPE